MSVHLKRNEWPLKEGRTRKKGESIKYHTLKARPANAMQREMTRWLYFGNNSTRLERGWAVTVPSPEPGSLRHHPN